MSISSELTNARELFTATEFGLLTASYGEDLTSASPAELKKKISLVRELRDKWRDKFTRQRRTVQRQKGARITTENDRSQQKSEFFAQALARYEAQLSLGPAEGTVAGKTAPAKKSKLSRNRGHRSDRTAMRKQLKPLTTRGAASKPKPAASAPTPAPAPAVAPSPKPASATVPKKPAAAPPATRPVRAAAAVKKPLRPATTASTTGRLKVKVSNPKSLAASAAAKKNRIKISGLDSRTRGHVSARGKRSQAKRDGRNKK